MKRTIALLLSLLLMLQPVLASAAFSLPSALKSIQAEAFAGNKAITGNLQLPDNVRSVGDRAFADTDVFSLRLPAATTSVGSRILAGADAAYVVVENATASLADSAFDDVEILFGKDSSTTRRYADANDVGFFALESCYWHDGFVYYNHGEFVELVTGAQELSGSVTIPQSVYGYPVEMISGFAFMDQDGLTSISLPDTLEATMPAEEFRTNWPAASISFYSTGVNPVIPPEADPENGGFVMELDIFPASVTLMPGETFIPVLEGLPDAEYIFSSYSTDESVVAVNESLDAFAVAPGSAAFTVMALPSEEGEATASELGVTAYYGTVQIRVVEPEIAIDLFESTVSMNVGQVYYPRLDIKTPSTICQPELNAVSADPAVADAYFVDGELMLEAKGEGKATIAISAAVPAYGDYEAVTATAEIKLNVTPAAFETTYSVLYTYTGLEHDFDVLSELTEDDVVSYEVINDLITYNEETARVIIGEQPGESAVVVTIAHADGTQDSVTVPVYIKPFLAFGAPQHRDDLHPDWEYHYEWQNLMPELERNLWPHDNGLIYTYAEVEDEQLSIENEMTEGKPVIIFTEDEDDAGNIWVRSICKYPGTASVTYYATLNTDILPDTVHVPVAASEPVQIEVQPADVTATLDSDVYHLYGDEIVDVGYWYDSLTAAQQENFASSDESIFTVNGSGLLVPHNPGEATLTYTVNCFGVTAIAEATVVVHGGSFELAPAEATIGVGERITLVPVLPQGANGTHYEFYPDDDAIVSVNELGVVTGLRAGSTYVHYNTEIDGAPLHARSLIHVVDEGARLMLNSTSLRLYEGEFFQLEAIYSGDDEPVSIEWASTRNDSVSVDENGLVWAGVQDWSYPDSEVITCTAVFADGSVETASCLVCAEEQIVRMTDEWGYYELEVGQTQEFYGTASFAGNYTLNDFDVVYTSDSEEIVTVDENGVMTTHAEGDARIFVTFMLGGRCVFSNYSIVHVGTSIPQLGDDYSVSFRQDYYFLPAPQEGEVFEEYFDCVVSDPELHHYYTPSFSAISDPEDAIIVHEDGRFEIHGAGTAEVFVTLVSHDESVFIPEDFGGKTTLVVGETALRYGVTSFSGEEKETVFDEETGLPVVEIGDIVTVTVEGIPEHIGHYFTEWDHDYYAFREIARTDRTLTLQAQHAGCQTHLFMETGLDCNTSFYLEAGLIVSGEEAEFNMGEPSVTLAVGETVEIHPGFPDWEDGSFTAVAAWNEDGSEANASNLIAIGEEFPTITALAPGRVQLLASVMLYGEKLELPVFVTIVEPDWTFNIWDCEETMFVGQGYDPQIQVDFSGYHGPSITFSFSDPSLMEMNYDGWFLVPLAAGEVTITATIEGSGRTETVTRDVTIIEPSLTFADGPYMQLAPNERAILTLVNNTGKEIESVSWTASHENHAMLDIEEASPTSILVIAGGNYTEDWFFSLITANVTFTDGTTDAVSARIEVQPAHEIWPEAGVEHHHFELYPGELAEIPVYSDGRTVSMTFSSENDEIASVSANGVITAVAPGETQIVVRFSTYSDNVHEERVTVVVHNFTAALNPSELKLSIGESAYVVPTVDLGESGYWINDQRTRFWPMDDSVVSVDHLGLVTAKAPGSTVIVYETYTFHDDHRLIAYCPVTVTAGDGRLTLSETEISLRPREEFQLSATFSGHLESGIVWSSSNPDIITVTDDGFVKTRNWDIYEAVQTGAIFATAMVDGVETTAVCKVNLLPAAVSLWNSPNFYEIGVGERALVRYSVNANDPSITYYASFESTDEDIMIVDENGVMTGISEGVAMVRLNLTDEAGKLLCSGAAYVYVGTPLPTPADDDIFFGFEADHYYMTLDEEMGKHRSAFIIDPAELGVFYELHMQSDNEDIVICHGGDHIEAVGEGTTTIRAWFEGFEEYAVEATVTVGNPYLTFDKPLDENGNPIVAAGDTVTVTLHGMPTFGNMDPTTQITPQFVNINADLNGLREVSRGVDEEGRNTFILMKLGDQGTEANIEVCLECGWWNSFDFYVCIEETDSEFRMNESALVMAIGEEVLIWPEFDWKDYVSVSSSNEDAVTVEITDEGDLLLTSVGQGDAVITAEILTHDNETVTVETKVHSVKAFWRLVHLDHINESMKVGQHFELNPHILISGYHYPDVAWESSDPSILAVETFEDEWDWHAVPQAPGVATLTCYATMNGETQTLSKEIFVTEPRVYFADLEPEIRPNQTKFVPLVIVNDTDEKIVNNITYYSEDEGLVSVEDGLLEYGSPAAKITCVKANNSTRIFAVVEFKDGSVATAACRVWPMENEGVWIDAHTDDLWLSSEPWGENPTVDSLSLWWETNAALTTDPGNTGTDTAWIEWHIDNEGIARIVGFDDQEHNNAAVIEAVGEGETTIYATIRVYDANGNEIASSDVARRIFVEAPRVDIYVTRDPYEVQVGRREWVDWRVDTEHVRNETGSMLYTDDPSIAVFDLYGNIFGVNPGETTMRYNVTFGSKTFTGAAQVIVTGPEFRFAQDEITISAGETVDPGLILNANGYDFSEPEWHIDNPGVVSILPDGTLYGVSQGASYIYCEIDVDDIGYMETQMLVRVTGEAPAFCLSSDALTLWQESTAKLQIISNTNEVLNEETIRWSTSDESLITVDQEGNLTVLSGSDPSHDQVAAVFCDAETTNGDPVSMVCIVTVPAPSVRINEYQFWDGSWYGMGLNDGLGMWESYTLYDPSLTVEVKVTVDDESIVEYRYDPIYDWPYFQAVSVGATDAHYTITASNGETYTRSMRLLVDQDTTPQSLHIDEMVGEDNSLALCLEDGDQYVHVWFEPAYTGTELRFYSSNESVVTVDEYNSVLHPQNPGHATIFVECPEMPHLNTQFDVSIIREANVRLVAADGRTSLAQNDSVQLVFETTDGVMWRESDAVGFEFHPYYDENCVWVDENNVLHTRMNHTEEEITVRGVTWFMDGRGVAAEYTFSVDENEPYFFLSAWDDGNGDHMTLAEGSGFHLHLNTNQAYDPATLIYSSSNPEAIDFFAWDEESGSFHVHAFGTGEAELTVTIPECGMTATFPVRSIIPTEISKHIATDNNLTTLYVGDELRLYDVNDSEDFEEFSNFDEVVTFESDNPDVIDTIENIKEANGEDPDGHDWTTLRALKPGTATITMTATYANYPEIVCTDSVTITVLPMGEIVVNGAAFESDYLQLSTETWGFAPTSSEMTVSVDTNAPDNQITYTWALEREDVVALEIPEGSDGSTARFTAIGNATEGLSVSCRVQVGDLYDQTIYGYIDVFAPTFSASPDQAVYNLTVNETQRMNWNIAGEHQAALQSVRTYSSNESVAFADSYGMLVAVAPGTAVITREFYCNGVMAGSAQVTVNVTGAAATFTQNTIEIGVGESLPLTEYLNLQGVTAITQNWISADEDIALLSSEGVVYGVAPGRTIVTHVTYGTDVQNYQATCEVVVRGEPEGSAFTLSDTRISLFYEKQHQLRAYFNGNDVTDQVVWSMDYINEWAMELSDDGLLTGKYVKVPLIATAIASYTAGGRIHTAKCYVEVQPQMISIGGGLFSNINSRILYMHQGDTQYIYDNYTVASPDIDVELLITSDNENVARIDGNYIVAVGAGETDLHYTVTGSNGESYTLTLHVCVDMGKIAPTDFLLPDNSIVLVHDIYIIRPQALPAYAEYTCSYKSNDTSVCTVDEYGIVTRVNPGRTTIDVTLTGENGFSATKSLSVLSLGNITLAPADGRTVLDPGETVELIFSGEHMWNDDEVLSIDIYNHYGNGIGLTKDGVLTTYQRNYVDTNMNGEYTGQYHIPATIAFEGGQFYSCTYTYTVDYADRYFYATTGGINTEHLIANPGDTYQIVGYTNENWMNAVSYTYSSTNSSVASVDMYGNLNCNNIGSAVITVNAAFSDGTTGQDTIAVTVIPSEDLIITLEPERRLLHVGETIQAAFTHNGSTTYSLDDFTYSSSNPKVLRCNPPDEYGVLTFTALAPGKADLTITGTYDGYRTASATETIYVVATDGNLIIRSAALSSDYVELSTAANGSVPNVQGLWMEIDSNVDPSQFTYTWEIADENIASYYYPDENDHSVIHLSASSSPDAQAGETTVSCRVQCGDFFDLTYTAAVKVIDESDGAPLIITQQPEDVWVKSGSYANLSVAASGFQPLTYSWYYKDAGAEEFTLDTGCDQSTYSIRMTAQLDGRQMYCVITDAAGNQLTSDIATLYVESTLFSYEELGDGSISLTAYNGTETDLTIPTAFNGKKVASFGPSSTGANFTWKTEPVNLYIPDGIDVLAKALRYCDTMTSVRLPEDMTEIKANVFEHCYALPTIEIPDSVTTISDNAFNYCRALDDVTLPSTLKTLGTSAFAGCESLISIELPASIENFGTGIFGDCTSLVDVKLSNTMTFIPNSMFHDCTALPFIDIPDSVLLIGTDAFQDCKMLTAVDLPANLVTIDDRAFYTCSGLPSIVFPDSLVTIGEAVFWFCTSLTGNIVIPNGVTTVGEQAFQTCNAVDSFTVPPSVTSIGSGAFNDILVYCYEGSYAEDWCKGASNEYELL